MNWYSDKERKEHIDKLTVRSSAATGTTTLKTSPTSLKSGLPFRAMSKNNAFYLEVGVRSLQGGERLYYKRERRSFGSRPKLCEEEDTVVKLNVLQIYALTISIRPGKSVKYMWLDGQKLDLRTVQLMYPDDDVIKYTSQWTTTGYEVTKPGQRKRIPIEVEFTTGEFLKSDVHVKLYPATDRVHSRVGRMFGTLSLLCHAPEGTFVNVLKKQLF